MSDEETLPWGTDEQSEDGQREMLRASIAAIDDADIFDGIVLKDTASWATIRKALDGAERAALDAKSRFLNAHGLSGIESISEVIVLSALWCSMNDEDPAEVHPISRGGIALLAIGKWLSRREAVANIELLDEMTEVWFAQDSVEKNSGES